MLKRIKSLNCSINWNGKITIKVIDQIYQTLYHFCKETGYFKCSEQTPTYTHMRVRKIGGRSSNTFVKKPNNYISVLWKQAPKPIYFICCSEEARAGTFSASCSPVTILTTCLCPLPPVPCFCPGWCPRWTGDPRAQRRTMGTVSMETGERRCASHAGRTGQHCCSCLPSSAWSWIVFFATLETC